MTKIILIGACGRMGGNVAAIAEEKDATIVCGVDIHPAPAPFPVYRDLTEAKEAADAVIDFSSPTGLKERLELCEKRSLPVLLAATGYSEKDEATINEFSKKIPIFKTGNLSLGVNLLQILAKKAAQILGEDFDAEIVEMHHNGKKDAPSGTALMLFGSVNEGFGGQKEKICGRYGTNALRKKSEIGIHALRGGSVVGEHKVIFAGADETVTLSHAAGSRKIFAAGALKAAAWLVGKPAGLYSMSDMLE